MALDLAEGMLRVDQGRRPPATVADVRCLPLATGSCAAVVAAFSFNHVPDPHVALREAARVVASGGVVLASAYAVDDHHPVREAVDTALGELGWTADPWSAELRVGSMPLLATVDRALRAAARAGLDAIADAISVSFADLTPSDLVAWRLGMAAVAPYLAGLPEAARLRAEARALHLLGPRPQPLVRQMIVLTIRT